MPKMTKIELVDQNMQPAIVIRIKTSRKTTAIDR